MIFFYLLLFFGLYTNTNNGQYYQFFNPIVQIFKGIPYAFRSQQSKDNALKLAISEKNSNNVSLLLTCGANPYRECTAGITYLMHAAATGDANIYNLIKNVAHQENICDNYGRNLLIHAARGGCLEIIRDCYEQEIKNAITDQGWTPLLTAAYYGHYAAAKFFIQQEATSLFRKTNQGATVFMLAMNNDKLEIIQLLCNADISRIIDNRGITPLIYAEQREIIDNQGTTPLIYAAQREADNVFRWLLKRGHNPYIKDKNGMTVLMYCAQNNLIQLIPDLLLYGNRQLLLQQKNNNNLRALDIAQRSSSDDVERILSNNFFMTSSIESRKKEIVQEECTLRRSNNVITLLRFREINGK